MNKEIFELEQRFQPFLLKNDYTLVAPDDVNFVLGNFYKLAKQFTPRKFFNKNMHDVYSNKKAIQLACNLLPNDVVLKLYVVNPEVHKKLVVHWGIEEYCRRNKIDFEI